MSGRIQGFSGCEREPANLWQCVITYCISSALVSVIAAAHAIMMAPPGGGYVAWLAKDFVFHWMLVELAVPADARHGAWFDLTRYWPLVAMMNE